MAWAGNAKLGATRGGLRAAAFALFVGGAGLPSVSAACQAFYCTFADRPTDCGFFEESKLPNRATIVNVGRDGPTGVRLHTEPGDSEVFGSGVNERNDLTLSQTLTDGFAGKSQWWAHSIRFPDDYISPPAGGWTVLLDFHNSDTRLPWQANFHVFDLPGRGDLSLVGYGGETNAAGAYEATVGPVVRNVWYDFVYSVKWSYGPDGRFDAWVRKGDETVYKRVLAHDGPTLYSNLSDQGMPYQGTYLKLANYHSAFGQASSVIHDRVIRGATWREVAMPGTGLEGQHEENAASYRSGSTQPSWTQYGPELGTFSGGTAVASNTAGSTATFTFTGTAVTWMGIKCNVCGIATVSIDGGAPIAVDTAGAGLAPGPVFTASGLALGVTHSMVITVTGTRSSPASTGNYIAVDGFWVTPIAPS